MDDNKDIVVKKPELDLIKGTNISANDAFMAVLLGFLREPFMSSDIKMIALYRSISILEELNYSKEDIEGFKAKINEAIEKLMERNSFMG